MRRALCLLLSLALALSAPAGALAAGSSTTAPSSSGGSNAFSPGLPQSGATTPTSTTPTITSATGTSTTGTSSGLTGSSIVAIVIGAIIVLGGISFFIWRDSRRHARARGHSTGALSERSKPGSKRPQKARKLSPAERRRRKRGRAR